MTVATATVAPLTTAQVAAKAREYARANGIEVGTRGRLSADLFVAFLLSEPKTAREIAEAQGIPVSRRGRISRAAVEQTALAIR